MNLLCWLGFHKWKEIPDSLGGFGMGLEWFQCWECERCPATADQLREIKSRRHIRNKFYQVHPNGYR